MELIPSEENPYGVTGPVDWASIDALSTHHEIALVRSQLAKAKSEGAPPTIIAQLASVVGKLSRDYAIACVRNGKMIHIDRVRAFLGDMAGQLAVQFSDVPDWEARIDAVVTNFTLGNTPKQVTDLIGRAK